MRWCSIKNFMTAMIVGMTCGIACTGFTSTLQEGKQYQRVSNEVLADPTVKDFAKQANNKIQVLELFSYACRSCFMLEPYIDRWRRNLPDYVAFQRVPVEFQPAWRSLTRAFYTALQLDVFAQIHVPLFEAINTGKIPDTSENTLREFFIRQGVVSQDFNKAFNSFEVDYKQKWAHNLTRAYRISSVPAMLIQGPKGVFITTVRMAGSEEKMLAVVDMLAKEQHLAMLMSPKKNNISADEIP